MNTRMKVSRANNPNMIFKSGSTTFYLSSIAFSRRIRKAITEIYALVRVVDDFVDQKPQQKLKFNSFKNQTAGSAKLESDIVKRFQAVSKKYQFEQDWVNAFFASMETDLTHSKFRTKEQFDRYIYGSAEVIGFMISALHHLPGEAYQYSARLGYAFQMINFIRDINEDFEMGRRYFPKETLSKYGLVDLTPQVIRSEGHKFEAFINDQICIYKEIQKDGLKGLIYLPFRSKVAVRSASELFSWTADVITKDPSIILRKKVKPTKLKVLLTVIKVLFYEFIQFNRTKCSRFERVFANILFK